MLQDRFFWIALCVSATVFWFIPSRFRAVFLGSVSLVVIGYYDIVSAACVIALSVIVFSNLPVITNGDRKAVRRLTLVILALAMPLIDRNRV